MKKKTKVIIAGTAIGVVALSVGGTVILTSATNKVEDQPVMPNTTAVERMDLTNKITLSGTVKSGNISTVKSSLSGMKVKSVNVKVGDEVKKGDVIAVLDDSDLQEKLTEAKKSLKNTKTKNELELSAADRNYESTISAADKSVRDAEKSVSDAQKAYNEAYDEDNKIYKEYLEALEKKNKAYEKFKPYENKDKEKDSDEKEKAYSKACEKLAQKESNLSAAYETLMQKETALKEASARYEAARDELNKQKSLKRQAEASLMNAAASEGEDEEEAQAPINAADSAETIKSYDVTIKAAEKMLGEAEKMLGDAQSAYDTAVKDYNRVSDDHTKALNEKNDAYGKLRSDLGKKHPEEADEYEKEYKEARDKFEEKEKELKDANKKFEAARDELTKEKEAKKDAEDKAVKDRADITGSNENVKMSADDLTASQNKEIKKIKEDIAKCTIVAESDGVVTSLSVREGETFAGGEVAVVQDCTDFIISANADQYEIAGVEMGQPTRITVGAVGETEMEGALSFVAPTPETKDVQNASTIEYPVESQITDPAPGLRLGMKAKMDIIREEKKDVLAVPDECIQINENGEYYIEAVDDQGNISQVIVDYGMKDDYYSEITGDGVTEGMNIVMPEPETNDMDMGAMIF